jgi:hypothetical protein
METKPQSKSARRWTGRVVGGLPALFLLVDAGMKFAKPACVVEATTKLGYSEASILPMGAVLLASTILYLVPRTAVLGAVLLTGYLGGAVATHVFAHHGAFEIGFPVVFGILLWTGLVLRRENLLAMIWNGGTNDQHVPAV